MPSRSAGFPFHAGRRMRYVCCKRAPHGVPRTRERRSPMNFARTTMTCGVVVLTCGLGLRMLADASADQPGPETFTAMATVKTAGGGTANAPITIVVDRKMSQEEADGFTGAFKTGGAPALRKKLDGVPATGSIRLGSGTPTPTRLTLERATDKGRLLTIVTDKPILFLGGGLPEAKPKEG